MRSRESDNLKAQLDQWERIFETVIDGVVIIEGAGRFTYANRGAERILGLTRDKIIGCSSEDPPWTYLTLEGEGIPDTDLPFSRAYRDGATLSAMEVTIERADGTRVVVMVNSSPLVDAEGERSGMVAVFTDITDIYRLQRQRDDYLHMIAHDLRVPLTVIQGHAELLELWQKEGELSSAQESLAAIRQSCTRLKVMTEELVDAARLEGGQLYLEKQTIQLDSFLRELLDQTSVALATSRVVLDVEEGLPPVAADPGHLFRILANLLTNALKFSPPDGVVSLRVRQDGHQVVISVADQGEGIAAEHLPLIFERFFRVHNAGNPNGVGLGLYITRLLVRAQGGSIWAESEKGEGSTFSFTLPAL